MTLVEIYDGTPIENFISTLALKPRRTVFVGSDTKKTRRAIPRYQQILAGRGIKCEMSAEGCPKNDLGGIYDTVLGIISENEGETYVIDISGGDGGVLTAAGMLLALTERENIFAFRINPVSRRGVLFSFSGREGGKLKIERNVYDFSYNTEVYLTCEENIILHGGVVCGKGMTFGADDELCGDVERLWNICRSDPSGWNHKIGRLSSESSRYSDTDIRVISKDSIGIGRSSVDAALWNEIVSCGFILIDEEMSRGGSWFFRYKNRVVEECLNKAGSALEYRTYLAGIRAMNGEARAFCSVETGITIGWDEDSGGFGGTQNEIDCMLMCGVCPIFISCKNGDIKSEELYKLSTVAEEFGSDYAKSVLLSTVYFDEKNGAGAKAASNLKRRANDMDIRLISKAHLLSQKTFDSAIENLI